jgi:hypothetical protein
MNKRAKQGGEIGINGERYAGGTFLPSTRLPKRGAGARTGSGKALVAPGVIDVVPDGKRAIFAGISALIVRADDGTITALPEGHSVWGFHLRADVVVDCARWNAGERFK